ncbi:MAG: sigma-70 family RNA polymerase sigma factor [Verrucomicrobia bacterium]|nr:sigma-70 family RNA polymerase sigma factor [Verrucomicrobiota bacterium]
MSDRTEDPFPRGILEEVARGSERAMQDCISRYGGLVWSIAERHVRDRSSTEDVVQETFTDLWKSANRYNPAIATEVTFIGMLARRRAIDFVRKASRRPQLEPLCPSDTLHHPDSMRSDAVRWEGEAARKALKQLPPDTQELFFLHFDEGMTHPEISEKTGLPLGTVKTRLRRGLIEVRDILRRTGGSQPSIPSLS